MHSEVRHSIDSGIVDAQKAMEAGKAKKAWERLEPVRNELAAQKVRFEKHADFLKELDLKEQEVAKLMHEAAAAMEQQAGSMRKRAAEEAQRREMLARGYELWDGQWLTPQQIRARGYRKVDGRWVPTRAAQTDAAGKRPATAP